MKTYAKSCYQPIPSTLCFRFYKLWKLGIIPYYDESCTWYSSITWGFFTSTYSALWFPIRWYYRATTKHLYHPSDSQRGKWLHANQPCGPTKCRLGLVAICNIYMQATSLWQAPSAVRWYSTVMENDWNQLQVEARGAVLKLMEKHQQWTNYWRLNCNSSKCKSRATNNIATDSTFKFILSNWNSLNVVKGFDCNMRVTLLELDAVNSVQDWSTKITSLSCLHKWHSGALRLRTRFGLTFSDITGNLFCWGFLVSYAVEFMSENIVNTTQH